MKRLIFSLFFTVMAVVAVNAQQIAVVSGGGATSVYQTLAKAIEEADPGSTIYLPGGGFQISDDVKITKRLYIIGIGHKAVSENADGNTVISGNLFFENGSDNSAIMGCYISGNINIGEGSNNILVKYCNVGRVSFSHLSSGTVINQNYIRNGVIAGKGSAEFTNNVTIWVYNLDGGIINNNIITSYYGSYYSFHDCDDCTISNNIIISTNRGCGSNCLVSGNMTKGGWGDDNINVGDTDWNAIFADFNNGSISPASNFHFKGEYQRYEGEIGIYGGTEPFNDSALPPVPYIVSKVIPEQTDASGKLNIKIRVKAGE
jgi:hypothetical protein